MAEFVGSLSNCDSFIILDRKIHEFVESIKEVLDTPAKRTLWFNIVPILLDDDQEYCKRSVLRIQEFDDVGSEKKRATFPRSSIFSNAAIFNNTFLSTKKSHWFCKLFKI